MKRFLCIFLSLIALTLTAACNKDGDFELKGKADKNTVLTGENFTVTVMTKNIGRDFSYEGSSTKIGAEASIYIDTEGGRHYLDAMPIAVTDDFAHVTIKKGDIITHQWTFLTDDDTPLGTYTLELSFHGTVKIFESFITVKTSRIPCEATYAISSDGKWAYVTGYDPAGSVVNISDTFEGLPVKKIDDEAFYYSSIIGVTIPDTVESIGYEAFGWCKKLKSINIPASVNNIERFAFTHCESLAVFEVSEENPAYRSINGHLYTKDGTALIQYAAGSPLWEFTLPDQVTKIESQAFSSCKSLTKVTIHDGVEIIDFKAFTQCDNLISLTIPFTGGYYGATEDNHLGYIFGCHSPLFHANDMPQSLKEVFVMGNAPIPNSAFYDCNKIEEITVGGTIDRIDGSAFKNCSSLKRVTIGQSVKKIGSWCFSGCHSLSEVVFECPYGWYGTNNKSDWQNSTGGTSFNFSDSTVAAKLLSDVTDPGMYYTYYWYLGF